MCVCHGTGRQWAQAQESVRTGQGGGGGGGGVGGGQRDDEEEGEEMGLLSMMDAPISQSALGSSKKRCGGWRHLGGGKESAITHGSTEYDPLTTYTTSYVAYSIKIIVSTAHF